MSDAPMRAVITGAAGGIGAACAERLARGGARLVLADREEARLDEVADRLADATAVVTDVTVSAQCAALADLACDRLGGVDAAVLAAGVARHVPLLEMTREQWDAMLAVHLTGTFDCIQAIGRVMTRQRQGAIVVIGSSAAAGLGPPRQAHYVAAKAGAIGLVRAAARELGGAGVRVNAVSPGFTDTPMNAGLFSPEELRERAENAPLGRVATPEDVAGAVEFLLGDASGFMTGQTLQVNGGAHMP